MHAIGDVYLMAQEFAVAKQAREEAIYRRHAPDVFAYLLRHIPTYQDAEDLLVEVFLIVLEKLPSLTIDEQRLAAYARTIARNKMVDYYRQRGKRQIVSLEDVAETMYEPVHLSPEQRALAGEQIAHLHRIFKELPEQQQMVLRLRFIHGLHSREIAAHLAKSENAVRVMLSRSLTFLRKYHALREERD
ncbi:MAG TPA: sigma-70 family RNA polymerase sigma factor [Ktedonobacteraceae bacterium]